MKGFSDGWCIHYRGISDGNGGFVKTCKVGVEYDAFRDIKFEQRPCFLTKGKSKPNAVKCAHLRLPTPEEIAEHEREYEEHMKKFTTVLSGIMPWRKAHKGKRAQEVVECPACKGRLHLSISAYNGHVHGHCETSDCVRWME